MIGCVISQLKPSVFSHAFLAVKKAKAFSQLRMYNSPGLSYMHDHQL